MVIAFVSDIVAC